MMIARTVLAVIAANALLAHALSINRDIMIRRNSLSQHDQLDVRGLDAIVEGAIKGFEQPSAAARGSALTRTSSDPGLLLSGNSGMRHAPFRSRPLDAAVLRPSASTRAYPTASMSQLRLTQDHPANAALKADTTSAASTAQGKGKEKLITAEEAWKPSPPNDNHRAFGNDPGASSSSSGPQQSIASAFGRSETGISGLRERLGLSPLQVRLPDEYQTPSSARISSASSSEASTPTTPSSGLSGRYSFHDHFDDASELEHAQNQIRSQELQTAGGTREDVRLNDIEDISLARDLSRAYRRRRQAVYEYEHQERTANFKFRKERSPHPSTLPMHPNWKSMQKRRYILDVKNARYERRRANALGPKESP